MSYAFNAARRCRARAWACVGWGCQPHSTVPACALEAVQWPAHDGDVRVRERQEVAVRIERSITSVSWIPSDLMEGMGKMATRMKMAHHDPPPPNRLGTDVAGTLEQLCHDDRFRFANHLSASSTSATTARSSVPATRAAA
jgi:hypothetical protein